VDEIEISVLAQALVFHVPWWFWAIVVVAIAVSLIEEQQRASRRTKHHAYLKSAEWKARRSAAIARAGGRCMDCGSRERLHVHHLTYSRWRREEARDLQVLCARCHRRRHRSGGRTDDLLDRFVGWISH